jgi:hypothetical protein
MRKITLEDGSIRYEVMEQLLTEEEYQRAFLQNAPVIPGACLTNWKRPVISDGAAVHPLDVPAAMARDKLHGLNIEYTPDDGSGGGGRPIFESRGQRRAFLKSMGYHDRDGGYGD